MIGRVRGFACAVLLVASSALAQGQRSYPTVIGPTGRPYGPTQAEYQYQKQYGHPSPESQNHPGTGMEFVNGYPGGGGGGGGGHFGGGPIYVNPFINFGYNPYPYYPPNGYVFYPSTAFYTYGNPPGYLPQPLLTTPTPPVIQGLPDPSDPLSNFQPGMTGNPFPTITPSMPLVDPSTPQAVQNSLHFQGQGDEQLQVLNFVSAAERYRKAIDLARDRPEPRYRLGLTLAARSRFLEAIDQLKLSVAIDPSWPARAERLDDLIGSRNTFEKERIKTRVAEWTLQDARDPNRLFLLAVFLHWEGDEQSKTLLKTAVELAGNQQHLAAFLEAPLPTPSDAAQAGRPSTVPPIVNPLDGMPIPAAPPQPHPPDTDLAPSAPAPNGAAGNVPVPPIPDAGHGGPVLPPLPG